MSSSASPSQVTVILQAAVRGDQRAAAELLPLIYGELRRLAQARLAQAPAGNTLQPTALVHEAYLRLLGNGDPGWEGRGHFFGAAARAMRDILVEQARRKAAVKHGGGRKRLDLEGLELEPDTGGAEGLLELDSVLKKLEAQDPRRAEIVMLRCFAGLSEAETAAALGLTDRTVRREWRYLKAWMMRELEGADRTGEDA